MDQHPEHMKYLCGIDEAGRGPVFGPMVISLVCGNVDKIVATGAKDSKEMSQSSREISFDKIMKAAELVKFEIISSKEINHLMDSMTLNEIEEKYVLKLLEHSKYPVIVDSFDVNTERCSAKLSQKSGKNVKSDVNEGKQTLLMIKAMEYSGKEESQFIEEILKRGNVSDAEFEKIKKIVEKSGSYDYSRRLIEKFISSGKKYLDTIDGDRKTKEFLLWLSDYLVTRKN